MQPSIIVGFLVGYGSLVLSVLIDSNFKLHAITAFFNFSAMLIIFGGIAGAIIISFPVEYLKQIPVALKKAFLNYEEMDVVALAIELVQLAQKSRQEGILALDAQLNDIKDPWLRLGLQLVVDGMDRQLVKAVMEAKLEQYAEKVGIGAKVFFQLGGFAPTLGIIGTVMGLVHMLANLEDSSKIGGAIAVAFLATFWGILSANLIFLPISNRVKTKDAVLISTREAMIEGILSIQAGEPVRVLEERLKVFMDPETQERFIRDKTGGSEDKK